MFDALGDCIVLLMNNGIYFFSIATGQQILPVIGLNDKNDINRPASAISAGGTAENPIVIACGEKHNKIFGFNFVSDFPTEATARDISSAFRLRVRIYVSYRNLLS